MVCSRSFWGELSVRSTNPIFFEMPEDRSIDVDTPLDLNLVEMLPAAQIEGPKNA